MKDLNDVSLRDLMPGSIAQDGCVDAAARSIDPQLRAVSASVDAPSIYAGFDGLPSDVLDQLAAQYDVTVWRDDWPESVKRSVLRTAITDKRKKGTVGAVKNAVSSLGSAVTITEHGGHRFTIYVAQGEIAGHVEADVQSDIIAAVEDAKPVRSHYDFVVQQPVKGALNACGFLRCMSFARVSSSGRVQDDGTGGIQIGVFARPIVRRHLVGEAVTEIVMPATYDAGGAMAVTDGGYSSVTLAEMGTFGAMEKSGLSQGKNIIDFGGYTFEGGGSMTTEG